MTLLNPHDSNITKGNWGGCVTDRDQPNDVKDTAPSGGGSLFPVADCGGPVKSLPLTTNWSALESMVDTMKPAGMTNVTIGAYADGDFFSNLALGYAKYGLVPETLLPYQPTYNPNQVVPTSTQKAGWAIFRFSPCFIKEWNVNTGVSPGQLSLATECIKSDIPVAAGLRWPTNGNFLTTKVVSMDVMIPPVPSKVVDGHSIAFVGYKKSNLFPGGGYFIFRNSWGSGWWDGGYGYMSFAYVAQYANDLFVLVP